MAERRYKIYEQLGAGGNGAVFRAYDAHLKRWVAIKRLLSAAEAESNPDAEELRREADTLASLRNANIVTIFDVGTDEEGLFMVMELLEGPDLADTIQHGPLMLEDFKQLAEQTLEALLAAHNLRILHRDLKPENIKVERLPGGRFQAKIIDFGLARSGLMARKQTEDQAGSVMGSIYYMAPEQLSREPTDIRTDLYSLGCVFYEALSSRKAFDGKSVNEVIDKHIDHDLLPLNQLCPHLPQWLTYWVMRLMACKKEDRPATAQQAIEEFRAWEKLPPAPQMMPWMPVNYGYGAMPSYGPTASQPLYQHTTANVPVQTDGYYVPPHITSSSVPVPATLQAEPIPVAVAVPARPQAPRVPQPARPVPNKPRLEKSAASNPWLEAAKQKKFMVIGGAAVALLLMLWMIFGGDSKEPSPTDTAETSAPAASLQIGAVREDLYPTDRGFPIPDHMRAAHFIAKAATRGYTGSTSSSKVDSGSLISVWEDLSKRGGNNALASRELKPEYSPERVPWKTTEGGVKEGRTALQFTNKSGKPVSMRSYNAESGKDDFPFGKASPASPPGLTLAVVLQANSSQLPCRVITLQAPNGQGHVTLSVNTSKAFEAEFKSPSGSTKLTSSYVDATKPSVAILIWNPANDEVQLRTRDQSGRAYRATGKAAAPKQPLHDLEIGSGSSDKARMYSGLIADVVLLATAQKEDQTLLLDKELREHYFTSPKPGVLNPTKNPKLADFAVGEERNLFNGRDLAGWEGSSNYWSVKDGTITVKGSPGATNNASLLVWKDGTVGDFDLKLRFKTSGSTNSGVHYRSFITSYHQEGASASGYHYDIDFGQKQRLCGVYESGLRSELVKAGERVLVKDHSDLKKATLEIKAGAFPEGMAEALAFKTNQWYELRIVAEGNIIKHWLNDKQVCEYTDEGRGRIQEGIIALQWHTYTGATGQFKDIRLKRLR